MGKVLVVRGFGGGVGRALLLVRMASEEELMCFYVVIRGFCMAIRAKSLVRMEINK